MENRLGRFAKPASKLLLAGSMLGFSGVACESSEQNQMVVEPTS